MHRRTRYRRLLLLAAVVVACVYLFYPRLSPSPLDNGPATVQKPPLPEQPQRPSRGGVPRRPRKNRTVRPPRGGGGGSGGVGGAEGHTGGAGAGDRGGVLDGSEVRPSELEMGREDGKPDTEQPHLRDHDESESPVSEAERQLSQGDSAPTP